MSVEEDREPCSACGRPTLRPTLLATGGFCRRCRPGQPAPKPPDASDAPPALPFGASPASNDLVPVFIPALAVILLNLEKQKGSPLTQSEVLDIRDKSVVMMMERSRAAEFSERRGYPDIDPHDCWAQWLEFRKALREPG